MSEHESDTALVAAARAGDRHALARLFRRHRPLLLAVCRRALVDPGLAEDAAQEAALQAMLSLDRLTNPERFGSWLAGIGLNICRRLQRQRMREAWSWEAMQGGQRLPDTADAGPGPEEAAEAAELRAWIDRAVAALPPGQRAAVLLYYLAGLTQAETAALLGIEVGAVKTRLHKARANLRRELWRHEPTGTPHEEQRAMETLVEMRVADVRRRPVEGQSARHFVVLAEVGGRRSLPIWIGEFEATAIALHLEQTPHPRPLTYAFAADVLRAVEGQLKEVRINKLEDDVFYATAIVAGPVGEREVDARPSDALNLALVLGAPIRVAEDILAATSTCEADEWARRDELTEGAAAIVAGVVAAWDTPQSGAADETPG